MIDVNIRGRRNFTPLITAAQAGHNRVTRLLIKSGADLNLQDDTGFTSLMAAALMGHTRAGMELLQAGGMSYVRARRLTKRLCNVIRESRSEIARARNERARGGGWRE